MKFNISNYKGKYAMHCKTNREAKKFCNYLHSVEREWGNGEYYIEETNYHIHREDTVYFFNSDSFGDVGYAREERYTILEFSDFDWEFTKADLKTGDVVLKRNGSVEIVNRDLEMLICNANWNDLDDINEDLTSIFSTSFDIIEVRRPERKQDCCFYAFEESLGTLVYEYEEPEEMTLAEVCELLGKKIKIIG